MQTRLDRLNLDSTPKSERRKPSREELILDGMSLMLGSKTCGLIWNKT